MQQSILQFIAGYYKAKGVAEYRIVDFFNPPSDYVVIYYDKIQEINRY